MKLKFRFCNTFWVLDYHETLGRYFSNSQDHFNSLAYVDISWNISWGRHEGLITCFYLGTVLSDVLSTYNLIFFSLFLFYWLTISNPLGTQRYQYHGHWWNQILKLINLFHNFSCLCCLVRESISKIAGWLLSSFPHGYLRYQDEHYIENHWKVKEPHKICIWF